MVSSEEGSFAKEATSKVLLALTALPDVMATQTECALAATVSEVYDDELGCALVQNLPPEKLLALQSQLQDFSNNIAMLDLIDNLTCDI